MRRTRPACLIFALLFAWLCAPPARGTTSRVLQNSAASSTSSLEPSENVYVDASAFAAELRRIGNAIEENKGSAARLGALKKGLPTHWEVATSGHRYYISAEALDELLGEAGTAKNAKSVEAKAHAAADWAFDVAAQAKAFAGAQNAPASDANAALERILSRREFGPVKGPSALELLRQRIYAWLAEILFKILRQVGRHPISASIFFWALIIGLVVWLAVALFRYWTRKARFDELEAPDAVAYTRTWQEWMQAAREAAARGDYREAIHAAYWAGISSLEDRDVVRKDRTRTPREYMRLVSNATQLVATGRKTREALSALTITLEQVWYGRKVASNQDFTNALQSVEALGCQLQ